MKKNTIRLTEAQLHRVIKESVKRILKEYEWNGRTPEQDAASINAANTPTSPQAYAWQAQRMQQYADDNALDPTKQKEVGYKSQLVGYNRQKANQAAMQQYGGTSTDNQGRVSNSNLDFMGGTANYHQQQGNNGVHLFTNVKATSPNGQGFYGRNYKEGDINQLNGRDQNLNKYQQGIQAMNDTHSGAYNQRMNQRMQQRGNLK